LLILASALGGAGVTGLVAVALKAVDLSHRHDDTRRDHYVTMHLALDSLHQTVLDGVQANNGQTFGGETAPGTDAMFEAWTAARTAAAEAQAKYNDAMRAYRLVGLFAPAKIMEPLNNALIPMTASFLELHRMVTGEDSKRLPIPEYPHDAVHRFANAVRQDLGMRKLKLYDNPASLPATG
jgi:hypothetical protein